MPSGRYAVFVDAGYLLAAGGWVAVGTPKRREFEADTAGLVKQIQAWSAEAFPGQELLRLYWFDAAPNRQATDEQVRLMDLDDTKVRLGQLTSRGDQKGVDSLILSDLTTLARERSIDSAVLVAGDGDLVEAVTQAQGHGIRVHLWGIDTKQNTVSPDLRREADRVRWLTKDDLEPYFTYVPPASGNQTPVVSIGRTLPPLPTTDLSLPVYATIDTAEALRIGQRFAEQWSGLVSDGERTAVREGAPRVPGELDYRLIRFALESAGMSTSTRLAKETLYTIRDGFWDYLTIQP